MKKISLFFLLLFPSLSLLASIRIISTSPASASCNGGIYVEATGTAGPFRLKVTNASGFLYEAPMSSPTTTIAGLCTGAYTVQVFNTFGCAKTLEAQVGSATENLSALPATALIKQQVEATLLKARAFPNPFNDDFQVELEWDRPQSEVIEVEIRNALGQLVQAQRQEMILGRNTFKIKMQDASSRGFLQVLLRDRKGRQVVLKVMQVRE